MAARMNVGITGMRGFIGSNLASAISSDPLFRTIEITRDDWTDTGSLSEKCRMCDAIVHFAGLSRHDDGNFLYDTNVALAEKLAMSASGAWLILASTTHIDKDLPYHQSKRECERLFRASGNPATTLLIANTFGPGGKPFYNSVVSTFCFLAANKRTPDRIDSVTTGIVYVREVVSEIIGLLRVKDKPDRFVIGERFHVPLAELWNRIARVAAGGETRDELDECLEETVAWYRAHAVPCE